MIMISMIANAERYPRYNQISHDYDLRVPNRSDMVKKEVSVYMRRLLEGTPTETK